MSARVCEIEWPTAFNDSVAGSRPTGKTKKCVGKKTELRAGAASAKTHMAGLQVMDLMAYSL